MIKLTDKKGQYWVIPQFKTVAHWLTKKEIPALYRRNALRICTRFDRAWGINHGSFLQGIEVLEWEDIPVIYRRVDLFEVRG